MKWFMPESQSTRAELTSDLVSSSVLKSIRNSKLPQTTVLVLRFHRYPGLGSLSVCKTVLLATMLPKYITRDRKRQSTSDIEASKQRHRKRIFD